MGMYSAEETFPAGGGNFDIHQSSVLVVIDANGGDCAISADRGDGVFVPMAESPFTADDVFRLDVAGGRFRFTPSGGAVFGIFF